MNELTSTPSPLPTLYKVIRHGQSFHGGTHTWSLPTGGKPGEWHEVLGQLEPCQHGFHLTTDPRKVWYYEDGLAMYVVEVDFAAGYLPGGASEPGRPNVQLLPDHEWVVRRVRLVREVIGDEQNELLREVTVKDPQPAKVYALLTDGKCPDTGFAWPLPTKDAPGAWAEWQEKDGRKVLLRSGDGLRITSTPKEKYRVIHDVWEVEVEGGVWVDKYGSERAMKARLLRRLMPSELDKMKIGVDTEWKRRKAWAENNRYKTIRKHDPKGLAPGERFVRTIMEYGGISCSEEQREQMDRHLILSFELAIQAGLEFKKPEVFDSVSDHLEALYTTAAKAGNESACVAIEGALGRKEWRWEGKRLHVGAEFEWIGMKFEVTEIDDAAEKISAVARKTEAYTQWPNTSYARESYRQRVVRRVTIARATLERGAADYQTGKRLLKKVEELATRLTSKWSWKHVAVPLLFLTKEERVAILDWSKLQSVDKKHDKKHVSVERPSCLQSLVDMANEDHAARTTIEEQVLAAIGPEPVYDPENYDDYSRALKAWSAKKAEMMEPLLSSRTTSLARLERARNAWAAANYAGTPHDYLDKDVGKGKGGKRGKGKPTK